VALQCPLSAETKCHHAISRKKLSASFRLFMVYLFSFSSLAVMFGASATAEFRHKYVCPPGGCAADEASWLVVCGLAVTLLICACHLSALVRHYRECVGTSRDVSRLAIARDVLLVPSSITLIPPFAVCCMTVFVIVGVFLGS